MNDIQYLNVVWILASFLLLHYGITGDGQDMYNGLSLIVIMWLIFWYIGQRQKMMDFNKEILKMGEKAKGQWDYRRE